MLDALCRLRKVANPHAYDKKSFFTFVAILIESGMVERLNRIMVANESQFSVA